MVDGEVMQRCNHTWAPGWRERVFLKERLFKKKTLLDDEYFGKSQTNLDIARDFVCLLLRERLFFSQKIYVDGILNKTEG